MKIGWVVQPGHVPKKKGRTGQSKKSQSGDISLIWGEASTIPIKIKICMVCSVPDVIMCAEFQVEIYRDYDFTGDRISKFPIDFRISLTTVQCCCTACDDRMWNVRWPWPWNDLGGQYIWKYGFLEGELCLKLWLFNCTYRWTGFHCLRTCVVSHPKNKGTSTSCVILHHTVGCAFFGLVISQALSPVRPLKLLITEIMWLLLFLIIISCSLWWSFCHMYLAHSYHKQMHL